VAHKALSTAGLDTLSYSHFQGANEMEKHQITVVLGCVLALVALPVSAQTPPNSGGPGYAIMSPEPGYGDDPIQVIDFPPMVEPGPDFGLPVPYEGWEPWHNALRYSPSNEPGPPFPIPGRLELGEVLGESPYEGWEPWHNVPHSPSNGAAWGVPEPGGLVLLIGGGLCLLGRAWRRRHRR